METNELSIYADDIKRVVSEWEPRLIALSEEAITRRENHQHRTIKQLIGHLIDSASNNHQRMVRLQYNENLIFPDYQQDNDLWIAIQDYQHADWPNLVTLWKSFNIQIAHLILSIDKTKLNSCWTNFEGAKVTLKDMVKGYPDHLNLHLNDIREILSAHQVYI
jgi:hypothetical protein